jgi:predicted phosphohydrolase
MKFHHFLVVIVTERTNAITQRGNKLCSGKITRKKTCWKTTEEKIKIFETEAKSKKKSRTIVSASPFDNMIVMINYVPLCASISAYKTLAVSLKPISHEIRM